MSKPYSGIPLDEKRTWVVPRWLKEAFVAFAIVSVLAVGISKGVQHFGAVSDRARSAVEADEMDGKPAFSFKLPARGGGEIDLSSLRGKTVLVNFWATWCPPCREEMPSLWRLAQSFDPQSFEVVTVSVDDGWEPVEKFLAAPRTPYRVALDEGAKVSRTYGTTKYPESYLVDRDGKLRLKFVGPRNWTDPNVATLLQEFGARRKG
ncbi:MAG: TlpA family protein disulfide reductase [Deltaproteobacteria bacterium]|nr:MAG: TlpA family protein disulfide reductase [Deltaproteobacteria bacterium]TMA76439.1 MAG: TlpA family protein disulfide reductase [Deltaproteobacteria bacterium]TMB40079.1 MAG: TlpA family protein disulfide reductase [Deltaproteobacteria bacterium]